MPGKNVDSLRFKVSRYISRGGRKARKVIYLTVDAGAGGVAVARDEGRRDDERKTDNVDSLMFNDNGTQENDRHCYSFYEPLGNINKSYFE